MRKTSKHKTYKTVSVEERGQAMNRQTFFFFPPSTVELKRKAENFELAFRPQGECRRAVETYGRNKVTEISRLQVCDVVRSGIQALFCGGRTLRNSGRSYPSHYTASQTTKTIIFSLRRKQLKSHKLYADTRMMLKYVLHKLGKA